MSFFAALFVKWLSNQPISWRDIENTRSCIQRKAMFPEGGDADAAAAYVSMYQKCVKGW